MRRDEGFAMVQVLILIMIILMFLTSLFSYAGFRHRAALMRIQTEEAKYAAKAAVKLMETEIENGKNEWQQLSIDDLYSKGSGIAKMIQTNVETNKKFVYSR